MLNRQRRRGDPAQGKIIACVGNRWEQGARVDDVRYQRKCDERRYIGQLRFVERLRIGLTVGVTERGLLAIRAIAAFHIGMVVRMCRHRGKFSRLFDLPARTSVGRHSKLYEQYADQRDERCGEAVLTG